MTSCKKCSAVNEEFFGSLALTPKLDSGKSLYLVADDIEAILSSS
jgi:hypothetical protein